MTPNLPRSMAGLRLIAASVALASAAAQAEPAYFQGSAYEVVAASTTWDAALLAASQRSWLGVPGRLATIGSAAENTFVAGLAPAAGYWFIGGSDAAVEGTWAWVTGKEAGTVFWRNGAAVDGAFTAWRPGEPNNFYASEDHLVLRGGLWQDQPGNMYFHSGYIVEYSFVPHAFDFAMSTTHAGAIRNISAEARLVRLDITLAGDTVFDSAPGEPGHEFTAWSVLAASPGAGWTLPDNLATDGQRTVSMTLDLDPTEALAFQVDLDRLSTGDGPGLAAGTTVTAHFLIGDLEFLSTATVAAGDTEILGHGFAWSAHSEVAAPVPEPAGWALLAAGGLTLALLGRRRSGVVPGRLRL